MGNGVVITQENGSQGRTSYGPRETERGAAGSQMNSGVVQEAVFYVDGDNPAAYIANDETSLDFFAGGYLIDIHAYAQTAIADVGGVDLATVKQSDGTAGGPALAGLLASASAGDWEALVIDAAFGADDLQLTVASGLAAGEKAVFVFRYINQPPALS